MVEKVVHFQEVAKKTLHFDGVNIKNCVTLRVFLDKIYEDIDLIPILQNLYFQ